MLSELIQKPPIKLTLNEIPWSVDFVGAETARVLSPHLQSRRRSVHSSISSVLWAWLQRSIPKRHDSGEKHILYSKRAFTPLGGARNANPDSQSLIMSSCKTSESVSEGICRHHRLQPYMHAMKKRIFVNFELSCTRESYFARFAPRIIAWSKQQ